MSQPHIEKAMCKWPVFTEKHVSRPHDYSKWDKIAHTLDDEEETEEERQLKLIASQLLLRAARTERTR